MLRIQSSTAPFLLRNAEADETPAAEHPLPQIRFAQG
jgi:hypothetical protein